MNPAAFCEFVNNRLLPSSHLPPFLPRTVSLRTAIRWLHRSSWFQAKKSQKGSVHRRTEDEEREDVVKHRKEFLKVMEDLRKTHQPPPQCSDEEPQVRIEVDDEKKKLVVLYHDESIYYTNEGQTWMWADNARYLYIPFTSYHPSHSKEVSSRLKLSDMWGHLPGLRTSWKSETNSSTDYKTEATLNGSCWIFSPSTIWFSLKRPFQKKRQVQRDESQVVVRRK